MKKLFPAICMTLVAAAMFATSTFAWFSMNTTVTATGMQVTAKSDTKFLQIVNSTGSFSASEAQISATATNDKKEVRPTTAVKTIADDALTALDNATTASAIKWAEAFSDDPAVSTATSTYTDVTAKATATDSTNVYTLINDFKVRLNPNTGGKTATNLAVSGVTITATNSKDYLKSAVKVLFVCDDNWAIWDSTGEKATKETGSILAATVKDTPETEIKVYIFFDGEVTATTTNNATTVGTDGYNVEFTLSVA